jgi:phosphohistidine phosphatase
VRARQTAEIIAAALHERKKVEFSETLTPGGSAKKLVDLLNHFNSSAHEILLVGHEPHLSEFISLLVAGKSGCAVVMKKGGLCKLGVEELHFGRCAALEWLLTPAQMSLVAGE